jgi:threonine dehydratase
MSNAKSETSFSEISIDRILKAEKVLAEILVPTPLVKNYWLSELYQCEVFLKLETAQPIGSFKIRGATYKISQMNSADRKKGIIAASAGNHAQGVAWGAKYFGLDSLIVMPVTAPLMKVSNTQALGAEIHQEGNNYDESYLAAQRIISETGRQYVHAFHDPDVIAGQATIATEILAQCPDVDFVVASIGGGGMVSGMGLVLKDPVLSKNRKIRFVGCQAQNSSSMVRSIQQKNIVKVEFEGTFADGIAVQKANPDMFKILSAVVDDVFESDEEEMAMNVLRLMEKAKTVSEGSAAIVLGALDRYQDQIKGKKVVLVISGGNIDVNLLSRIIDRGLIRSGRKLHLKVQISDRPGSLARLTELIGGLNANILQAIHDRSESSMRLDETEVDLVLETRGPQHSADVINALEGFCNKVIIAP